MAGKTSGVGTVWSTFAERSNKPTIFRFLMSGLLCALLALGGVTTWSLACETNEQELNTEDEPGCDPCKDQGNAGPSSECSNGPINLMHGFVTETATDTSLPGTGLGWSHTRTYNSLLDNDAGDLVGLQGMRWETDNISSFLRFYTESSTDYIDYYVDATHKRTFSDANDDDTYDPPADYRVSLVHYPNTAGDTGDATSDGTKTSLTDSAGGYDADELIGRIIRFTGLGSNSTEWRVIEDNDETTIEWDADLGEAVAKDDPYEILDRVVLTFSDSEDTLEFAGNNGNWDAGHEGLLLRRSDPYGNTLTYAYDEDEPGGRIITVVTSQGWSANYAYIGSGSDSGRLQSIVIRDGSDAPLSAVGYVYFDSGDHHADCGTEGDLVLVNSCEDLVADGEADSGSNTTLVDSALSFDDDELNTYRLVFLDGTHQGRVRTITDYVSATHTISFATLGSTVSADDRYVVVRGDVRSTHYRYTSSHQLKMVLEPEMVAKLISDSSGIDDPVDILAKTDTDDLNDGDQDTVEEYASRSFTYYTDDLDTDNDPGVNTAFGAGEHLEGKYGGDVFDETGFVKSETINSACGGCGGGSAGGITRTYYYMAGNTGSEDPNYVYRIVVEDTTDSSDNGAFRKVFGLNHDAALLREIVIDDPDGTPTYWCRSTLVGTSGNSNKRVTERRMPSAHNGSVDDDTDAAKFLDPTTDANDSDTLDSDGVIYKYYYDSETRRIDETVRNGESGTEYVVASTEYGDGVVEDEPKRLPTATYVYASAVQYQSNRSHLTSGIKTEYEYDFHDTADTQMQQRTTKTVAVPTTENGPNVQAETKEYYDTAGRLRWTQDAEGHITYYSYHPDLGTMAYQMVDVESDDLPTDITQGDNSGPGGSDVLWVAWTENSSACPYTHTDDDSLQLVTRYEYDDLGRQTKVEDPEGVITYTVYLDNETRVYPAWDADNDKPRLPVQVTRTDDAGSVLETCSVDPTSISFQDPPDGTETLSQSYYVSWTTYTYDANGQLEEVDRYHDVPSSGSGTLGTNYYATLYRYDELGRREYTIQHVSGTSFGSAVEQVTKTVYDVLGRVIEVHQGVSGTTNDASTCSDETLDGLVEKVSASFYDEATPGSGTSGVGDGLVTSTRRYFGTGTDDWTGAISYANWRHQLRGTAPCYGSGTGSHTTAPPYTVYDVDWMGRTVAVAQFAADDNFTDTDPWDEVLTDDTYAQRDASFDTNRRTLSMTLYDTLGRVYRTETWAVDQDDGSADSTVTTDNYYDKRGRLVATEATARGATEYAYDGAGRRTEVRVVTELESTKYTSGAFNYRDPQPGEVIGHADSTGDDKVLQIARTGYDKAGNVTESLSLEAYHDDTNGLRLTDNGDEVKEQVVVSTTFSWYDGAHRRVKAANYGANTSGWTYADPPTWPSDHSGVTRSDTVLVTTYDYGGDGRLQTVTDPKGIDTVYTYDALGRRKKIEEDESGDDERTTLFEFDGLSNVLKRIADADNDTAWNAVTKDWSSGTTGDDQVTVYTFADACDASLVTRIKYPDGDEDDNNIKMAYHLDGSLDTRAQQKTGEGTANVITYGYDSLRRLETQCVTTVGTGVDEAVKSIKVAYDDLGRMTKVTSYSSNNCAAETEVNEVVRTYNDFGQVEKEYQEHEGAVDANTLYVMYGYGDYADGFRPVSVRYPCAGESYYVRSSGSEVASRQVYWLYTDSGDASGIGDAISRVTAVADSSTWSGLEYAAYSYNGVGHMVVEDFTQPEVRLDYYNDYDGSPVSGAYEGLDRFGRVKKQIWRDYGASSYADHFEHAYDRNSNRTQRDLTLTGGLDELYTYDDLNRLTSMQRGTLSGGAIGSETRQEDWGLDALGNWETYDVEVNNAAFLEQERDHNDVNEVGVIDIKPEGTGTDWADVVHDTRGNMTTIPQPAAPASTYTCVYDAWNRLVEVKSGAYTVGKYEYDGLNRRVKSHIDSEAHGTPNGVDAYRHFFYNTSWQLLETRLKTGGSQYENTAPDTLHLEFQYVRSLRYIDALVLRDENTGTDDDLCDDERLYYTTDANMNVTALLEDDGDVAERYAYDPYGSVTTMDPNWTVDTTPDYDNHILYCGYYLDWETGLYHVRNRMYHAQLGRWLTRDPLGYVDGMSLYLYLVANPIAGTDPLGLEPVTATTVLVGAGKAVGGKVAGGLILTALAQSAEEGITISGESASLKGERGEANSDAPSCRLIRGTFELHREKGYNVFGLNQYCDVIVQLYVKVNGCDVLYAGVELAPGSYNNKFYSEFTITGKYKGEEEFAEGACRCCARAACFEYEVEIKADYVFLLINHNDWWHRWSFKICGDGTVVTREMPHSSNSPVGDYKLNVTPESIGWDGDDD